MVSAVAERDLEVIWSDIAEDASPDTADRLIDAIIERFQYLLQTGPPAASNSATVATLSGPCGSSLKRNA